MLDRDHSMEVRKEVVIQATVKAYEYRGRMRLKTLFVKLLTYEGDTDRLDVEIHMAKGILLSVKMKRAFEPLLITFTRRIFDLRTAYFMIEVLLASPSKCNAE